MMGILAALLEFLELLASKINQAANLITSTSAVLCALSFTAGTILLQKLPSESKSPGEKWLEDFLAKTYSLAIDTGYHKTGTIVKRYVDEFVFHEFPNFGVDTYSGKLPRTRPNFNLGEYLSEELGSSLWVDSKPQPIETSEIAEYKPPLGIIWSKLPVHLNTLLWKIRPLRGRIMKLTHPRYGRERYTTVSYALYPTEAGEGSRPRTQFNLGTAAKWGYSDIKRFESKSSRIRHFALEVQYLAGWFFLLIRRLPVILSNPRNRFYRGMLATARQMRREDTQRQHETIEIRNLQERILYSRRPGKRVWRSFAIVTFLFDREEKSNHALIYFYSSELQYLREVNQFARSMLHDALMFGIAAVLGILSLLVGMMTIVALVPYSLAWYALLQGLWKFERYFIGSSKEQENVSFAQPLRCPSCKKEISLDTLVCPHCKSTVSAKPPPKPPTVLVVSEREPISVERWNKLVTAARREHAGTSRKTIAIPHRPAQPSDVLTFKEFRQRFLVGPEILIDAYSAGGTYTSPEIIGIGRNIAIQEEGYLIQKLADAIANRTSISRLSGHEMEDAIRHSQIKPNIVFAPIEYYTPLHMAPRLGMGITYDKGGERLVIGKMTIPIFWSNTYVPFNEFMFLESGLGEWVFKPDNESNWLRMELSPERKSGKFEVTTWALAEFLVKDKDKGLIVTIQSPRPT